MNLNFYSIQKTVKALADNAGLASVFETDKDMPRTDGKTIYLPQPKPYMTDDELLDWTYKTYHEIGHETPKTRDWKSVMLKYKINPESFEGYVNNILDDFRQEFIDFDMYAGRAAVLSQGRSKFMSKSLNRIGKDSKDDMRQAAESLWAFDAYCRSSWMPDIGELYKDIYEKLTSKSKAWFDQLKAYESANKACVTAEDIYALSNKLIKEVFKFDPKESKKPSASKDLEGDGKEGKEGKEGKDGDSKSGKVKAGKESKSKGESVKATVKYEDLLMHKHDSKESSYPETEHRTHIDYSTYSGRREYVPYNINEINIEDYAGGFKTATYKNSSIINADITSNLSTTVRKLLQVQSLIKHKHDQKQGRVDNKNLYRVTMKDAIGYNERVFKQKLENLSLKEVVVSILMDFSGSMSGTKITEESRASAILSDTLSFLNIKHEVLGYTEDSQLVAHIFKYFDQKVAPEVLLERFSDASRRLVENADGDSILFAYNRLKGRKEKRKLLIVMSDGSPCCSREGDIYSFTKDVVKSIEASKVEIYGIGIMNNNVKNFYKDNVVIQSASELEGALLNVIKTKLIK